MKKILSILFAGFIALIANSVFAAEQASALVVLDRAMTSALDGVFAKLQTIALPLLFYFSLIQLTLSQWKLLFSDSDITTVISKLAGGLSWVGLCLYAFENGPPFIKSTASYAINQVSGMVGHSFSPTYPIENGISVASQLLEALDNTQSVLSSLNPFPAILMGLISVVILASSTVIAFRIFMIFIETKIVIAMSPVSFALLGLNALRDQGFAPLKYLIAMVYRIFMMGAIVSAMNLFAANIIEVLKTLPASDNPSVWPPLFATAMGYSILGGVAWISNGIANSLASGSSAMTSSDAGGPAAIAAAVGGALGSGGMTAAIAGSKPVQAMGDFMKSMGGSVGVSNASSKGQAGGASTEVIPGGPSLSKTGAPGSGSGSGAKSAPGSGSGSGSGVGSGSSSSAGSAETSAGSSNVGNSAPNHPSGSAGSAAGASQAASATGASPAVANAASEAAGASAGVGGAPDQVALAALDAGATPAQATAAAVGAELGRAGAGPETIAAGTEAALAGKSPGQIDDAVKAAAATENPGPLGEVNAIKQGGLAGHAASMASYAIGKGSGQSSIDDKQERHKAREMARAKAGADAGIAGASPNNAPQQKNERGVWDHLRGAKDPMMHGARDAVHVSMHVDRD